MRKKWKSGVSLFLAAALTLGSIGFSGTVAANETGMGTVKAVNDDSQSATTYYIDSIGGNDNNSGTTESLPWKSFTNLKGKKFTAGDQILLKAGSTWNDQKLEITGAEGTEGNEVILGKYGEGANPVINGKGSSWLTDRSSLKKEDVAAVHIKNSKYVIIENLEVTNWESDAADLMGEAGGKVKFDQSKYMLTGILVENNDAGDLPGIVIRNNYVHDVNGYMSQNGTEGHKKGSGGIMALVTGGNVKSYFTNLKITGNKVEKVCHEAIYMESCWAARPIVGGASSQQAGDKEWVGWPNVSVTHNYVNDVAGDGIVLINADGGKAEHNLITKSASEEWDYSRNPAHAAIWMWDCNNVTMQYNEAGYTTSTQDGMAFDCDYGNQNVMYQYNYSHDNKGGFWMACPGPYYTVNSVVRYNVSINDGLFNGSRIIRVGEKGSVGHQFYNNTIYWNHNYTVNAVEQGSWGTPPTSGTDIYNNIFCGNTKSYVNNEGINYNANCIWGGGEKAYPMDEDFNVVIADPGFVDVANHNAGSFDETTKTVTLGSVDGFKLKVDSPCIDAGVNFMDVPDKDNIPEAWQKANAAAMAELVATDITAVEKDYAGNTVPYNNSKVDIGAFEYQGAGTYQPEVTVTDKTYLQTIYNQAAAYKEADFMPAGWKTMADVRNSAKTVLDNTGALQVTIDAVTAKLEEAIRNMVRQGTAHEGTVEDSLLKDYKSGEDNAGFETDNVSWGKWPDSVTKEVTTEQKHSGEKSLKVVKGSDATSFSEIGGISVEPNTKYILEAWFYCPDGNNITSVGMEAKHHNSFTSDHQDHKLLTNATITSDVQPDEKGWYKFSGKFTTEDGQTKLSVALVSQVNTVYMDDVVLYPETIEAGEKLDRTALESALKLEAAREESYYTPGSWQEFKAAKLAARLKYSDAMAEQAEIKDAADRLTNAYNALTRKANKRVLQLTYDTCKAKEQGNATDAAWSDFQAALVSAEAVLGDENAGQAVVDEELEKLKTARDNLNPPPRKDQVISVNASVAKTYGDKAFSLGAKLTYGDGTLTYKSSDKKVAEPDENGNVTIKGTGSCTITITAEETDSYKKKTATVTITVKPKQAAVKKLTPGKKSLKVTWGKDDKATGYEVECCLKNNFKSGVKKATISKAKTTSTTFKNLIKGKRYYVRIRAYKTAKVNGKSTKITGAWSKVVQSAKVK